MQCSECYWCTLNHALSDEVVCCNEKSENYNKVFPKDQCNTQGCESGQTKQEIDYWNMTPWQFASKYYM